MSVLQTIKLPDPTMGDQVSFKAVLLGQDQEAKEQVRRFVIPQDASSSLVYLREKLRSIFGSQFSQIHWLDEENDQVIIDSDEELMIALHEMKGPVYKLFLTQQSGGQKAEKTNFAETQGQAQEAHPGVVCDSCEGPVIGHRYKCLKCLDYDLCAKCEAKGIHPGHNMMRIATPDTIWPRHLFNRLSKMQDRVAKMRSESSHEMRSEAGNPEESSSSEQPKSEEFKGFDSWRGRGGCRRRGWGGFGGFGGHNNQHWEHHLMNLGEAVKSALDPFGVDVDIDIETSDGDLKNVNKAQEARAQEARKAWEEAREASKQKMREAKESKKGGKEAMREAKKEYIEALKEAKKS